METNNVKKVTDAFNESGSISYMNYPARVESLKENQVIIKIDGCNKEFKITIEPY